MLRYYDSEIQELTPTQLFKALMLKLGNSDGHCVDAPALDMAKALLTGLQHVDEPAIAGAVDAMQYQLDYIRRELYEERAAGDDV